ncbi:MAG: hypothetical protein C5B49_00205 [Bdellovibrio sp.]|nr:MAG: hypothetical protein C5B49_00205 [Bdellovibrio sp.]
MVNQNFSLWKRTQCKGRDGAPVAVGWATHIDKCYKGLLLVQIMEMPKKSPITLDEAINIISDRKLEAFNANDFGMKPGQYHWYSYNFLSYISDLGHHIDLTGDEIESYPISEVRA